MIIVVNRSKSKSNQNYSFTTQKTLISVDYDKNRICTSLKIVYTQSLGPQCFSTAMLCVVGQGIH